MPVEIPQDYLDLLTTEKRAFADLAVVLNDGTPQVSPVWFDFVDGLFIINTARGRVKDKALKRHPVVAMSIRDPDDPYRYLLIRGPVVEETEEGGADSIRDLNLKYHGDRNYNIRPGMVRVIYKIKPERVFAGN
ncbi:MAG: pyridoxamine 5'-phosphate oxidase family protein [Anaerolineales bacterium]